MEKLNLQTEIRPGKDIESNLLFDGERRKIMQITLRRSAVLKAHQAAEPIAIQCVAGAGELLDINKNKTHELTAGVLITVEAEVVHEVRALPEVSILLIKLRASNLSSNPVIQRRGRLSNTRSPRYERAGLKAMDSA